MASVHDLQFAIDLARGAGRVVVEHYGKVSRQTKRDEETVTEADRATQRFIVAGLKRRFPDDGVVGEEDESGLAITYDVRNAAGRNWVIDPIDGTNNFVSGLELFAVSIGLLEAGQPTLGVVYDVMRDQVYSAARGQGAWMGKHKIAVLQTPPARNCMIMLTSTLVDENGILPDYPKRWFSESVWKFRMLGTAALEAANVAAGVAHAAITVNGKLWDCVAPAAIVLEAGGLVTDLRGREIFPFNLKGYTGGKVPFIAAGPAAHERLLADILR